MMKTTAVALLAAAAQVNAFGAVDATKLIAGFMNGVLHQNHEEAITGCLTETTDIVVDVMNMVSHFSAGGLENIGRGIQDIGQFLIDLPNACYYCSEVPEDFRKLIELFSIFGDFQALSARVTYNMLWHYSEIKTDISNGLDAWEKESYFESGTNFGEALVLAIGADNAVRPEELQ